jgi:hypothetical protein
MELPADEPGGVSVEVTVVPVPIAEGGYESVATVPVTNGEVSSRAVVH